MATSRLNLAGLPKLETWISTAQNHAKSGTLPSYIPPLAQVDKAAFALCLEAIDGEKITHGDTSLTFPLMSVIKPFLLLYCLAEFKEKTVFKIVGTEYSDQPFNSFAQLQQDGGKPRNPMINSGAIALSSLLPGKDGFSCCQTLQNWLNHHANCRLFLDEKLLYSVNSTPNPRNQVIAAELEKAGYIQNAEIALDTYNHICCLAGNIADLTQLGMLLVKPIFSPYSRMVKAIMLTCGLYQASSRFAVGVGVPVKSGVSGVILAVIPGEGVIACYSPPLDAEGNSLVGLFLVEQIVKSFNLSVFE
ncbi:glutaminase [Ancylothrix sp. C2]|uniref:glutaminase n=1 Tax=Ancylothrix sp. D3o TaxID=2953691 RepID=UPI0021BB72AA|nr:glutaminase [Ancylothrix sp. D3o]MCT7952631.1 glutaminase [Ancylothrix sp. D3o]